MNRRPVLLDSLPLLLLASLAQGFLAGCAVAPARQTARNADSPPRNEVQRRLAQIFDAAEKKDFQRLDSYHLFGPDFSKFAGLALGRQDAEAARAAEHLGLSAIHDLRMRAVELKIDTFARTAIATFILEYQFRAGGRTVAKKERATLVFVKQHGEWLIAHEHLSAPP